MAIAPQRRSHLVSKVLHIPHQFYCGSKRLNLHRFNHDVISEMAIRQTPRERGKKGPVTYAMGVPLMDASLGHARS